MTDRTIPPTLPDADAVGDPDALWAQMVRDYPRAVSQAATFRAQRGAPGSVTWPEWCWLPMGASHAIASSQVRSHARDLDPGGNLAALSVALQVSRIAALLAWRPTRGVYEFHPALLDALMASPVPDELPTEVFYRLPEWGMYLRLPDPDEAGGVHGAFVHLEHDVNTGRPELRFLLDTDAGLDPLVLHLGEWSIPQALTRTVQEARRRGEAAGMDTSVIDGIEAQLAPMVTALVSLTLYLCSSAPEISDPQRPGRQPHRPRPQKTRGQKGHGASALRPATRTTIWRVGDQLGQLLGSRPAPGTWSGHRDPDTGQYTYAWVHPEGIIE